MKITSETIKQIIEDLKKEKGMLDCEKADLLKYISYLYEEQSKPFKDEMWKLIDKWD